MCRWFWVCSLFVGLFGCGASVDKDRVATPMDSVYDRETAMGFEWFDALGFRDVSGKPLVKVATASITRS
jgi:hypothetical protein